MLRTLPEPAFDPEDVQAFVPGLELADAELYASLATLALEAAVYPAALAAPLPAPFAVVALQVAARLAGSIPAGTEGQVVSESIGSYTYRLATSPTRDVALILTEQEAELVSGGSAAGAYELTTGAPAVAWSADWWQRDYDRPETLAR